MKHLVIVLLLFIILFYSQTNAQSVLVSEYFNDQPTYEWNELLVVTDNLDMRGFVVTDNNTAQVTRQGGVRFKNIDFWRHVRAGTIIGIWHRDYPTNAKADRDTSMADGRIMLAKNDTMFFEAYKSNDAIVNDAPFNIAIDGDIIEVLDAAGNHIHALGHRVVDPAPGTYYVNMATPKMNVATSLLNGQSNRFFPGSKLEDYNGNQGDTIAKVCIENMTRTLPNKDCWTDSSNSDFWHFLRSPRWASPTLNAIVKPNNVELNWNTLSDSYPDDKMQGYLLIRDSGNVSTLPVNGTTYITGQRIGSSIVIANLPTSQTTFIDTLAVVSGTKYSYRVYAYRFGIDDELGNGANPNTSRGRQYNTTQLASVDIIADVEEQQTTEFKVYGCQPNPAETETTIRWEASNSAQYTLHIVDVLGRLMYEQTLGGKGNGMQSIQCDVHNFPPGMYNYTISNGKHTISRQVLVLHP